jgi:hypothetical protein
VLGAGAHARKVAAPEKLDGAGTLQLELVTENGVDRAVEARLTFFEANVFGGHVIELTGPTCV